MNVWTCGEPGCKSIAHGDAGAIGLRAIGWFFQRGTDIAKGPLLLCPFHHPSGFDAAVAQADRIQYALLLDEQLARRA